MRRIRLPRLGLSVSLALVAHAALAQTPAAPEFIVNVYTPNNQAMPSLSMDARGNFVVVWDSVNQDGGLYGIFGQRFDAAGTRVGAEFRVNTATTGSQVDPDVAVDSRGDFVVVWTDYQGGPEIKGQRFNRTGSALGAEFRANAYVTSTQVMPAVTGDAVGNFVVVWQSGGQDGDGYGVFGHRYDAWGISRGADFQVNSYVTGDQRRPKAAVTADGGFVVVFDGPDNFANGVHGRRFDAAGAPVGADFSLSMALATQFTPAVAALPQGGFVVTWTSYSQDGSHNGIFGRIFNAAGVPVTGEIAVNTYTTMAQQRSAVAADAQGNFVVIWESFSQDGAGGGVFGQRFDAAGARRGAEFQLNAYSTGDQMAVTVAADSAGNFVAAWDSAAQDVSGTAVVARRFQGLLPTALAVDTLSNGVLEPNETVNFVPSWRNSTTASQTFQGALSNFTGPPPGNYSIPDGLANYGTAAAGATVSCNNGMNCYSLTVTSQVRPAPHWDASVMETLSGGAVTQGLQKLRSLHVGDTFFDVPRNNAFYRFVETLVHYGVTGGCSASAYCPGAFITRDQMAVFVLLAREGVAYVPPACGTPIFNDVPASSPFCRWIEDLFRRSVVSGCGGGNYCPTQPVTREQMTIFVLRTLDPTFTPPACGTPVFNDVPASSPFCRWIEELARRGVVTGCGGGNYCPTQPVTREQMSVFLAVTFGLTLYGP